MTASSHDPRIRIDPLGDRAVRFARPAGPSTSALVRDIRAWPGVADVVVTPSDIAVYFAASPALDHPQLPARIAALATARDDREPGRDVVLDAIYDGPDLDDVRRARGFATIDDLIAAHSSQSYTVEFLGFAPGFAYLVGLPESLQLPRRATPRQRVPAGSLAIAAGYTAVYPFDSPGGWHLIGHVVQPMFGPDGSHLRPGDRVRFARSRR